MITSDRIAVEGLNRAITRAAEIVWQINSAILAASRPDLVWGVINQTSLNAELPGHLSAAREHGDRVLHLLAMKFSPDAYPNLRQAIQNVIKSPTLLPARAHLPALQQETSTLLQQLELAASAAKGKP